MAKMTVSHFKKYTFKTILGIQIVYLTLSIFIPNIPGWKMFAELNLTSFKILDVDSNQIIDSKKYMVPIFYSMADENLLKLAKFICKKENKTVRIELQSKPPVVKVFNKDECGS